MELHGYLKQTKLTGWGGDLMGRTMSAQERFRNILLHMGNIYTAQSDVRTSLLMKGLDEVVAKIDPKGAEHWEQVRSDSGRLLKVWQACEGSQAAPIMATEILSSIEEFSSGIPELLIADAPAPAPAPAPALAPAPPSIQHIPAPKAVFQSPVLRAAPPPVLINPEHKVVVLHKEGSIEQEEAEELEEEEEQEEVEEEVEEEEQQEAEEEEVVEPDAAEEEEEEEEEVEEEGMEVEKFTHRGRSYWIDTNTKKLYAIEGEDDVGDEVGIVINGKPVFMATAA